MGDVPVKCGKCGRVLQVSEFVDPSALTCPDCGSAMVMTDAGKPKKRLPTKFRKVAPPEPKGPQLTKRERKRRKRERAKKARDPILVAFGKWRMSHNIAAWVLFLVLGGLLGWLRYGGVITSERAMDEIKIYGMTAVVVIYIVIIIEAFSEDTFDGILCFFVPPYAIYYLFGKSDSFYLRALFAGVAVGFGYDLFLVLQDELGTLIYDVDTWIKNADW